ncbi:MAG: hypothetical protein CMM59_15480 [Rhodospirillaceae bacterium]|nr:hypothetical protein [Rhodospirillaceae bacterium]
MRISGARRRRGRGRREHRITDGAARQCGRRRRDVDRLRAAAGPASKSLREYRAERIASYPTVNAAVGDRQGSVRLPKLDHTKPGLFGAHGIGSREDGDTIGVLQLDDALKVSRCKFMKIDVEGMEANVIRGARDVIRRCRPVLYVENDRRGKSPELIRLLQEMDYSLYWHLPPLFNPENYFREPDNEFRGLISINMLCAPDGLTVSRADIYRISSPDDWWSDILPAGAAAGHRDKNILNTDPLRR